MKKRAIPLIFLLLSLVLASCGGSDDAGQAADDAGQAAVEDAVRGAANAFVEGFNNRDLNQFDTYFAPPNDQYGTAETLDAAYQFMDTAAPGDTFQLDKLEIKNVQVDTKREEATVSYYAEVSTWENGTATFTAVVTQDVSLTKINGQWLITGGDPANVQAGVGAQNE